MCCFFFRKTSSILKVQQLSYKSYNTVICKIENRRETTLASRSLHTSTVTNILLVCNKVSFCTWYMAVPGIAMWLILQPLNIIACVIFFAISDRKTEKIIFCSFCTFVYDGIFL